MTDLSGMHAQATRLILAMRDGLARLEAVEAGKRPGDPASIARELQSQVAQLQKTSRELESNWRMFVVREGPAKRDVWKRKVDQVSEEVECMQRALEKYSGREQRRRQEQADREELMSMAEAGRQHMNEMEEEAAVRGHVGRSRRMLAEMYEQGTGILVGMAGNREVIKRAQKRALDVINSIGLGDSLLRMIEKRHRGDVALALGGMVFLVLLAGGLIWWAWL